MFSNHTATDRRGFRRGKDVVSPEYMCISYVSGVYEYFPFLIYNDLLDVHVSCQCLDFPKIGFGHAQLSWITRTNGERTKHSRYHFMRVDFQSCLQGVERTVHIGSCGKNEIISLDSQICDSLENVKVSGKRKREEKNIEVIPSLQISEEFCEIQEGPSTPILGEDTPGFVMADDLHPDHPHFE
ncbi:hypothetical protein V6N11_024485 [Hibiscus sabdariffa]|uniref:Uncharacterized protein n=2 Tax=Hibiscus sabdariffa TaxID=183260 RepID=A0ABR1ZGR9_9ROSI